MKEDLSNSWKISIAVKIAAPILWLIIISSIILSAVVEQDTEKNLKFNQIHDADVLTHEVEELIKSSTLAVTGNTPYHIDLLIKQFNFNAVEFELDGNTVIIGKIQEGDDYINRPVETGSIKTDVKIYYRPFDEQIAAERKQTLFTVGPIFIAFGLIFAWLIKFVVIRPLLELVDATQKISEGNMDFRLNTRREDEFGSLARFFNQMMDNLYENQQKLQITAEQAKQASKAKSSFLANMSHELRTPLNAIIGYTEILEEDAKKSGNKRTVKDLNNVHVSGVHLLSLIDDILDISRIEAGKTELYIEEESLEVLVNNIIFTCQPLTDNNRNTLTVNKQDLSNITIRSDITKIRQILLNLIGNACKFTEDGEIILDIKLDNDQVEFSVIDTGIGISEEQLENIFHPFQQEDSSTTRRFGGSGLGLAISRHYCEMLNGELIVKNNASKGSTFKLKLPLILNKT